MPTILVVEDERENQELFSRYLKLFGYEVIVASDGIQAINMAGSVLPDLILMDMRLPRLNGWQVTLRLKAADATRAIPIIALTAHALLEDRQQCFAAGCDEYESKPVDFTRLLMKMRTLLDARSAS